MTTVSQWLSSLPNLRNVKPVSVTIKGVTWHGAEYDSIHNYTPDMAAVREGKKKPGEEYISHRIYLVGTLPAAYKRSSRVAFKFAGDNRDWYVSSFMKSPIAEQYAEYHPFGVSWQLSPWDIPNSTIDQYEARPYQRIPATINYGTTRRVRRNPRRRERLNAFEARQILDRWAIIPGTDFYAVSPSKLMELTEEARKVGYKKPRGYSGSTARAFYHYLESKVLPGKLTRARRNPSGVRIVYNKLLGGWYVVRGPHQTPLSGRFDSKAEAAASLQRTTSVKSNPRGRFVICAHAGKHTLYYKRSTARFIETTGDATHYKSRAIAEREAKAILHRLPSSIANLTVKSV